MRNSFLEVYLLIERTGASHITNTTRFPHSTCVACSDHHPYDSNELPNVEGIEAASATRKFAGMGTYILEGLGMSPTNPQADGSSIHLTRNSSLRSAFVQSSTSWSLTRVLNQTQSSFKGNGTAFALGCSKALASYDSARAAWQNNHIYSTWLTPEYTLKTSTIYKYITTTLCDGIPRAISPHDPILQIITYTGSPYSSVLASPYPEKPPCSVSPNDCDQLMVPYYSESASYASASSAWLEYSISNAQNEQCTTISGFWSCTVPGGPASPTLSPVAPDCVPASICSSCQITAQSVRLLYWPQTELPDDGICPSQGGINMTTFTAEPTGDGPNTQIFEGLTLTSPTAYMSFSGVGVSWCGTQSIIKTNALISMDPQDVSSLRVVPYPIPGEPYSYGTFADQFSYNYADFNTPMPYSVYTNAWFCQDLFPCQTMTPDSYSPILAYPTSFIELLNPMFSACTLIYDYKGVYDPPHALQPQPLAAQPYEHSISEPPIPHTLQTTSTEPTLASMTSAFPIPPAIPPTPTPTPNLHSIASSTNYPVPIWLSEGVHTSSQGIPGDSSGDYPGHSPVGSGPNPEPDLGGNDGKGDKPFEPMIDPAVPAESDNSQGDPL